VLCAYSLEGSTVQSSGGIYRNVLVLNGWSRLYVTARSTSHCWLQNNWPGCMHTFVHMFSKGVCACFRGNIYIYKLY